MKIKNRKIIYFILFFLIMLTVLKILFYDIKLFLNITPSIKMGLYFTKEYKQDIELKKGDFVIFSVPEKATKNREYYQDFIKEIVATEEDEVIVKNNEIFINNTFKGKILEKDSYGNEIKTLNEGKIPIANDEIFVMGENPKSYDSRYWGSIKRSDVKYYGRFYIPFQ